MKKRKLTRREAMDFATKTARSAKVIERDYQGSLALNCILVNRLGGRVEITKEEIESTKGRLNIIQADDKTKFIVIVETPAEEDK